MLDNLIPLERLYRTGNFVYDDNTIWTKAEWFNDIYVIDREDGQASIIRLPDKYFGTEQSHRALNKKDQTLYIIPFNSRDLLILDLNSGKYKTIELPGNEYDAEGLSKFTGSIIVEDELIMFGYSPEIVIYNILTGKVMIRKGIRELLNDGDEVKVWFCSWIFSNNKLYSHILGTNNIIVFDIHSNLLELISIEGYETIGGIIDIAQDFLWLTAVKNIEGVEIIRYNIRNAQKTELAVPILEGYQIRPFSIMAVQDGRVWAISGSQDRSLVIDFQKNRTKEIKGIPALSADKMRSLTEIKLNYFSYPQMGYINVKTTDNRLILIHAWTGQLIDIELNSEKVSSTTIVFDKSAIERLNFERMVEIGITNEYYKFRMEENLCRHLKGFVTWLRYAEI